MILTNKTFIKRGDYRYNECEILCKSSRMLRNSCLYYIKNHYALNGNLYVDNNGKKEYLFNNTHLYHKFKNHECFRTDKHKEINRLLPTKVLKQTFIQVNREFSSFYAAIKSYHKSPSKFLGKPNLPNYTKDLYMCRFPKESLSFKKKGYIKLSMTTIEIPIGRIEKEQIKEIIISPCSNGYQILTSYDDNINVEYCVEFNEIQNICGIDLGLNNLASLASNNPAVEPLIINGRPLKSINQFYNKNLAQKRSELPNTIKTSRAIKELTQKRNAKILDYLHKSSNAIINYLLQNQIHCVVVGSNKHWKQNINIGKRNNQNFVSIPFYKFKQLLQYKCKKFGIYFIEREESYTSKCSFLDFEDIKKHEEYKGRRVKRGLFVSSCGTKMNADINGAYNIIRKEFGNDYFVQSDSYKNLKVNKSSS